MRRASKRFQPCRVPAAGLGAPTPAIYAVGPQQRQSRGVYQRISLSAQFRRAHMIRSQFVEALLLNASGAPCFVFQQAAADTDTAGSSVTL